MAILDPGPDDPGHVQALLAAVAGESVEAILVSHTHRDHSPGARYLHEATGAPVLAAGPHVAARPLQAGETNRLDASADHDFMPDEMLADGAQFSVGEVTLEAVATPGHTANHMAFSMPQAGILLCGDHVMAWSTTVVADPTGRAHLRLPYQTGLNGAVVASAYEVLVGERQATVTVAKSDVAEGRLLRVEVGKP